MKYIPQISHLLIYLYFTIFLVTHQLALLIINIHDYIIHASFQRYLASGHSAALKHLHNLKDLNTYQNSIVIFLIYLQLIVNIPNRTSGKFEIRVPVLGNRLFCA